MAEIRSTNLTLLDWGKRLGADGNIGPIVELLSETNEVLQDAVFKEGNLPTGDRVVVRTGLPEVYWRALNQGIPSSKSTTAQVDEGCAMLEARSEVDKDLAMLNGNTKAFRLSEDQAFLEAMNQEFAKTLFYGDVSKNPKEFVGLSRRYGDFKSTNASNIIDAGGVNDLTSVYMVVWGDNTVYCPFPKGSKVGLQHNDLGENTVYMADNTRMQAYSSHFQWKAGLVVKDWRYVVRIANVSVSDLAEAKDSQAAGSPTQLLYAMTKALYAVPNMSVGKAAFYMNRSVHAGLARQAMDRSQSVLNVHESQTQYGTPHSWVSFLGVPLRRVDALSNKEAQVK